MSDWARETVTLVEIDQPFCQLEYGTSPCQALLGETDVRKCHNTAFTCQDRDNYDPAPLALRFCTSQAGVAQYDAIPSLRQASISPLQINIGGMDESVSPFGRRETCSLTFADHLHSDLKVDKYRLERISGDAQGDGTGYDPYAMGSFWGKWLARNPYHEGYHVRVYEGVMGQPIEEMQVRQYVIDKISGPNNGSVSVECKDLFSLTENRKAKAPKASRGELASSISSTDTEATLAPSGIGDEEYPASGWVAINDEAIEYTRFGDMLALSTRGALGTTAEEHENEDKVQVVQAYESGTVPDIVEHLLVDYANVDPSFIPKADWADEANENIDRLFTAYIAEPTPVEDLVGELAEQAGFSIWPDVSTNEIRLKAIIPPVLEEFRPLVTDEEWIKSGTLSIMRKPQQRTSQVWVYYGQRNPLEDVDDPTNYASRVIQGDLDSESTEEYGTPSVREVWGRWIPRFGRAVAQEAGDRILSIFRDPPFRGGFELDIRRDGQLRLASPFRLSTEDDQDVTGERALRNMVPIQAFRDASGVKVKFQQLAFFTLPDQARRVPIDDDELNFNLRDEHDRLYGAPSEGDEVVCSIADNVVVGSSSAAEPAFDVGDWPSGVEITIVVGDGAFIVGGAGGGGDSVLDGDADQYDGNPGDDGGIGFFSRYDVSVDNNGSIVGGGGGGGAGGSARAIAVDDGGVATGSQASGGGGGGGAGIFSSGGVADDAPDGCKGEDGSEGALTSSGAGGSGCTFSGGTTPGGASTSATSGDGGDAGGPGVDGNPGTDGSATATGSTTAIYEGNGGAGGSGGNAIDGDSFVTFVDGQGEPTQDEGTILGPRVN